MSKTGSANGFFFGNFIYDQLRASSAPTSSLISPGPWISPL
jgi:hypothetical protein